NALLPPVGGRFPTRGDPGAPLWWNVAPIGHQQGLPGLRAQWPVLLLLRNHRARTATPTIRPHSPMLRRHPDAPAVGSAAALSPDQARGTPPQSHPQHDPEQITPEASRVRRAEPPSPP